MKLELSRDEVDAIENYVWQHVRATNGKAFKVWRKMLDFLNAPDLFEKQRKRAGSHGKERSSATS